MFTSLATQRFFVIRSTNGKHAGQHPAFGSKVEPWVGVATQHAGGGDNNRNIAVKTGCVRTLVQFISNGFTIDTNASKTHSIANTIILIV